MNAGLGAFHPRSFPAGAEQRIQAAVMARKINNADSGFSSALSLATPQAAQKVNKFVKPVSASAKPTANPPPTLKVVSNDDIRKNARLKFAECLALGAKELIEKGADALELLDTAKTAEAIEFECAKKYGKVLPVQQPTLSVTTCLMFFLYTHCVRAFAMMALCCSDSGRKLAWLVGDDSGGHIYAALIVVRSPTKGGQGLTTTALSPHKVWECPITAVCCLSGCNRAAFIDYVVGILLHFASDLQLSVARCGAGVVSVFPCSQASSVDASFCDFGSVIRRFETVSICIRTVATGASLLSMCSSVRCVFARR